MNRIITFVILLLYTVNYVNGTLRCFSCDSSQNSSQALSGSCKDPFNYNTTTAEKESCVSGWCGKIIEGRGGDDTAVAIERICLKHGPSDSEERCANAEWNRKKVFMCFCQGDLCNSSPFSVHYNLVLVALIQFVILIV